MTASVYEDELGAVADVLIALFLSIRSLIALVRLKHILRVVCFFFVVFLVFGTRAHAVPPDSLSAEEELRRANDPTYAAVQRLKEQLKPIPEVTKLRRIADGIPAMSDDQLERLQSASEKIRQRILEKKKLLDGILEAQKELIDNVILRWALQCQSAFKFDPSYCLI